jgi:hypothetical protein
MSARVRKTKASQGLARQTKSNRENRYVIKVMNEHREGGQVFWSARTKGCPKPFNWSIINVLYIYSNLSMQGRFKMERYNYRDYNTPSKPNMHARLKTMQKETSTRTKRTSGREAAR